MQAILRGHHATHHQLKVSSVSREPAAASCAWRQPTVGKRYSGACQRHRTICRGAEESKDSQATTVVEASKTSSTSSSSSLDAADSSIDIQPGPGVAAAAAEVQQAPWKWEDSKDALLAYGVLAAVLIWGAQPETALWHASDGSDLLYFVALAVCTQYIGAHRGLTTTSRQQLSIKEGLLAPVLASVSLFSCYLIIRFLPDLDLATLLNAYFWLLGCFAGSGALGPLLRQLGGPLGAKSLSWDVPDGWLADEQGNPIKKAEFAPTDVLAVLGGVGLSTGLLVTQNYTLNNTMACLIATDILQLVGIRSFRVAGALLVGLLLYDVFWVFGSPKAVGDNVMLAVATSDLITGPARLLFPRAPGGVGEAADYPYSLLGLGDIAIPGLLACLALRYDASRCVDMVGRARAVVDAVQDALAPPKVQGMSGNQMADVAEEAANTAFDKFVEKEQAQRGATGTATSKPDSAPPAPSGMAGSTSNASTGSNDNNNSSSSSSGGQPVGVPTPAVLQQRTYFVPIMGAYVVGLLMAFAANSITHLGQPALLYIVPCTLGVLLWVASSRREVQQLWDFTDLPSFGLAAKPEPK